MTDLRFTLGDPEAYIGIKPCGCVVAICLNIVDTKLDRKETGRFVADLIRDGFKVEGVSGEARKEAVGRLSRCRHNSRSQQVELSL
jgi:hypothetical protein